MYNSKKDYNTGSRSYSSRSYSTPSRYYSSSSRYNRNKVSEDFKKKYKKLKRTKSKSKSNVSKKFGRAMAPHLAWMVPGAVGAGVLAAGQPELLAMIPAAAGTGMTMANLLSVPKSQTYHPHYANKFSTEMGSQTYAGKDGSSPMSMKEFSDLVDRSTRRSLSAGKEAWNKKQELARQRGERHGMDAEDINISGLKRTFGETLPFAERYLTGRAKSQRIGGLMGDGAYYIKSPSYNIIREGSKMPMNTRYSGRGKYGIRKARRVLASPGVRKVRRNLAYAANNLFPRRGPKPTTFESLTIEHGNLVVSGTEKVTDVYGCPADKSYYTKNFQLQPGNFLLFPKLSQTAANWVEYEFVQLVFEYKSIVPTNFTTSNLQNGRVYIATQMDVNKELWRTPDHFESQENKSIAYVRPDGSRTTLHGVECNPRYLTGKALKFVRIYNRDDELEKYDLGNTQMMVFGTGSDFENKIIGELHVSYKVKFKTQRVFSLYGYNIPSSMKMCDEDQDVTDLQKGSKMSTEHALDHVYESNIPFSIFGVGQSDDSGDLEGLMKGYTPGIKVKNVNAATNAVVTITGGVGAVSTQYFPKSWEEETINRRLSYDSTGNLIVGTSSGKLMNRCGDDNVPPVYLSYQKWNDNSKKYELTEIENEDTYNIEWKSIQFPPNLQGDYELTWKRRIKVLETSASTNGHLEAKIHPQKFRRYGTQTNSRLFALKESSDPVIPWKVNDKYQPNFYGMLDGNCDMPTYIGSEMHQKCFSRKLEPQASDLHNELSDGKGWIIMEETLIMHFRCSPAINDLGANEIWIPMIHSYNPDSSQISLSQEPVIDSGSVDYINPLAYNNTIIQEDIKVVQYNTFQRGNDIGLNVVNNFGVSQTSTIQPVVKHNECHTS